jgi:hypothetical protein
VRSSLGGALLVVTLCVVATGCASGVYGGAVTAQNPDVAAPSTSVAAPDFAHWEPAFNSRLALVKAPARFRWKKAVRATPTILAAGVGAAIVLVGHPDHGARWRFACWIDGSRDLAGRPILIQLQSLASNAHTWVKVPARPRPLARGWHRYSVSGAVKANGPIAVRAVIWVRNSVTLNSWLELGGADPSQRGRA